jgi:hypothetical protein
MKEFTHSIPELCVLFNLLPNFVVRLHQGFVMFVELLSNISDFLVKDFLASSRPL